MNGTRLTRRLIATDEAGYGPQLGPLVIAATCWELSGSADASTAFASCETGFDIPSLGRVRISDSKKLFSPGKIGGLRKLEAAMLSIAACISDRPVGDLRQWLELLSPAAVETLSRAPWFTDLGGTFPVDMRAVEDWNEMAVSVRRVWGSEECALCSASAAILPAAAFNVACDAAGNKATLLSEQTVALVMPAITQCESREIEVFSDKHGGRAYYGSMLQHFFPDGQLTIEAEGRNTSCYRIRLADRSIRWHFTAKGDSFAPVALASMVAKYTRERLMDVFNAYWLSKVSGLRPTAGYPGDARRFLADIAEAIVLEKIRRHDLVRSR